MTSRLEVVRGGALTTVQDLGRRGYAHLAVPRAGALDVPAMRLANRLVGNPEDAAVLETTVDGVAVRPDRGGWVAVTGALADVRIGGRAAGWGVPELVAPGEVVDVGRARRGVRSYVAIAGGIATDPIMGSRAGDLLAGVGPAPLRTGVGLPIGPDRGAPARIDYAPYPLPPEELVLTCYLGPRDDRLTDDAHDLLRTASWTVSEKSNRVGLRLTGAPLAWRSRAELPSEGLVLGSLQVPLDGQPVIFLADHPSTGGYPVVGVVPTPDVWRCGQATPGTTIRFQIKHIDLSNGSR